MNRRQTLRSLAALGALAGGDFAFAQGSYPSKIVTLVVPYAPGGPTDAMARVLANAINRTWARP